MRVGLKDFRHCSVLWSVGVNEYTVVGLTVNL